MSIENIQEEYLKLNKNRIEEARIYYEEILEPWILENVNEYCDTEFKFFSHKKNYPNEPDFETISSHFDGLKAMGFNIRYGCQICRNILTIVISIF